MDEITAEVKSKVGDWWEIDYITFANELRVDDRIKNAVNSIIAQKQQTEQAQLKVLQSKAEADQAVATADGERRVRIAAANGEAESILVKAKAQSDANTIIGKSLSDNPLVVYSIALEKWNGHLPTVVGSTVPMLDLKNMIK